MLLNKDRFGKLTSKSLDSIAALGLREANAELPYLLETTAPRFHQKHLPTPCHIRLLSFLQTSKNLPLLWLGMSIFC